MRRCFPDAKVIFISDACEAPAESTLAVWGMKSVEGRLASGVKILRLEDGFLRSVGLGADLTRPVSWVVDSRGIYFDASKESDLELFLAHYEFEPELLDRAAKLRERIVALGLTKYNVGDSNWRRPGSVQKVVLVPGQVESDDSIKYGAAGMHSNLELLQATRRDNPDSYIVYKPHPDVVAGMRASSTKEDDLSNWCDEVVNDAAMGDLLLKVDKVAVLTSLAGFEALLRNKAVTCYGKPFYSGWGLTLDVDARGRRVRDLSIDQLVAATLILYPVYLSRIRDALISPEEALDELVAWRTKEAGRIPWWRGLHRLLLRRIVGVR